MMELLKKTNTSNGPEQLFQTKDTLNFVEVVKQDKEGSMELDISKNSEVIALKQDIHSNFQIYPETFQGFDRLNRYLPEWTICKLRKMCFGLTLLEEVVISTLTAKISENAHEKLASEYLTEYYSQKSKSPEEITSKLLMVGFGKESDEFRLRFYFFLLFDGEETIGFNELKTLWGCGNVAAIVDQYSDFSLIQKDDQRQTVTVDSKVFAAALNFAATQEPYELIPKGVTNSGPASLKTLRRSLLRQSFEKEHALIRSAAQKQERLFNLLKDGILANSDDLTGINEDLFIKLLDPRLRWIKWDECYVFSFVCQLVDCHIGNGGNFNAFDLLWQLLLASVKEGNAIHLNALLFSVAKGLFNLANELLTRGADLNVTDENGNGIVHIFAEGRLGASFVSAVRLNEILLNNCNIQMQLDVNRKNCNGETCLLFAAKSLRNFYKIPAMLCVYPEISVNSRNKEMQTATEVVCLNRFDDKIAEFLKIRGGIVRPKLVETLRNSNLPQDFGLEDSELLPLSLAAKFGHSDGVSVLLKLGYSATSDSLKIASFYGHCSVVEILLENGASAKEAIILATLNDHTDVIQTLFRHGADVSAVCTRNSRQALSYAVLKGNFKIVEILLKNGADANSADFSDNCALDYAAMIGREDIVRLLLDHGGKVGEGRVVKLSAEFGREDVLRTFFDVGCLSSRTYCSEALIASACRGHDGIVKILLEKGVNVDSVDGFGRTALMKAAIQGCCGVAKILLENGANIDFRDSLGRQALMWASSAGHVAVVQLLLSNGGHVNSRDAKKMSALMFAALNGHEAIVRLLLMNGVDVNARNDAGLNSLIFAAMEGRTAVVKLLLEGGANIEAGDNNGLRALSYAAIKGHEDCIQLLVDKGADINAADHKGKQALMWAACYGKDSTVSTLLSKGANVENSSKDGVRALMLAAVNGNDSVVRILLENGTQVDAATKKGVRALMLAACSGHDEIVRMLLKNGADVMAVDENGSHALKSAAEHGRDVVVRTLLENGARIDQPDKLGVGALMVAAAFGRLSCIRILLENKANVKIVDAKGRQALMFAAAGGHDCAVQLLLRHGSEVNSADSNSNTVLMHAALEGCEVVVRTLLEHGASSNACDVNGKQAKDLAKANGHVGLAQFLEAYTTTIINPETTYTPQTLAKKESSYSLFNSIHLSMPSVAGIVFKLIKTSEN